MSRYFFALHKKIFACEGSAEMYNMFNYYSVIINKVLFWLLPNFSGFDSNLFFLLRRDNIGPALIMYFFIERHSKGKSYAG
jgi:hypothetical protein